MYYYGRIKWLLFWLIPFIWIMCNLAYAEQSCIHCHAKQWQAWEQSPHAKAMQHASAKTILGNFNNKIVTFSGVSTRFYQKNGKYFIHTQGSDGKYADYQVKYTFGVAPLQQYLLELPKGRLQAFTIAWDTEKKRWIALYDNVTNPQNPLHWTQRSNNWNHFCADCHSTDIKKNYDVKTDNYHTTWSAINVSCQACHGPMLNHPQQKSIQKNTIDTCAPCHSRRHALTTAPTNTAKYLDDYQPEILRKDIYHADGGSLAENYEYGSFLQSKMYKAGVTCMDCHDAHSLTLKVPANGICLQCHNPTPPKQRFPNLPAKNYNTPTHHFHQPNSIGAQCISCHMPTHTYMKIDVRHDHYIRVPRPDLTIKYGVPNACNSCHTNQSAQWAQQHIEKWYGKKDLTQGYTAIFALAHIADPTIEPALIKLTQDNTQSPIIRASAVSLLPRYRSAASEQAILAGLHDVHAMVRAVAARSLPLNNLQQAQALMPLLTDSVRVVRIAAARNLAIVPQEKLTVQQHAAFTKALLEYQQSQQAQIDQPEGNFNLGMLAEEQKNFPDAEYYFNQAWTMDKSFYPAAEKLAIIYQLMGKTDKARQILQEAIVKQPKQYELYYSLGLLFAEENDFTSSVEMLAKAVELKPTNPRVYYNYSLALMRIGKTAQAETMLKKFQTLSNSNLQH